MLELAMRIGRVVVLACCLGHAALAVGAEASGEGRLESLEKRVKELEAGHPCRSTDLGRAVKQAVEEADPGRHAWDLGLWIALGVVGVAMAIAWGVRGYHEANAELSTGLWKALVDRRPDGATLQGLLSEMERLNVAFGKTLKDVQEQLRKSEQKRTP